MVIFQKGNSRFGRSRMLDEVDGVLFCAPSHPNSQSRDLNWRRFYREISRIGARSPRNARRFALAILRQYSRECCTYGGATAIRRRYLCNAYIAQLMSNCDAPFSLVSAPLWRPPDAYSLNCLVAYCQRRCASEANDLFRDGANDAEA